MSTISTFYYSGYTKKQDNQLLLPYSQGSVLNFTIPLYADEQLKFKIGSLTFYDIMLDNDNSKNLLLDVEATIVVSESTIKYSYVRDSYKTITVDTQQTSGIFTKGTITRSYVIPDKSIRKLVYKPFI